MRAEYLFAGEGEQGIQFMGEAFKQALHYKGYDVARNKNYGPEAKGGKSFCEVVIKGYPLDWPGVFEADLLAVLSQEGYDALEGKVKKDGIIIYDPVLVKPEERENLYPFPISKITSKIKGRINMVLLGVILALTDLVTIEDICQVLREEGKFSKINQKSLEKGYNLVQKR